MRPERVDLHAVAEAQQPRVLHAIALAAELLPEDSHRAQLRVLLDEAKARVHEEGDAAEDGAHALLVGAAGQRFQALAHGVEDRDRVAHRVGDLLHRCRARLLEVVGADVDRVPLRDVRDGVGDRVRREAHRRGGRKGVGAAREELLDDVVLGRALELLLADALLLGGDDVEREQPRRGGVDRHRRVHLAERDAVHQRRHVAAVGDRDAHLAHLAARELVVGVVAGLRGQVERDREPRLPLLEIAPIELVGRLRRRMAGVGAHHPRAIALGQARRAVAAHVPILRAALRLTRPPRSSRITHKAAAGSGEAGLILVGGRP